MKAVYSELHHTLMSISDQDDLKWWKNNHGPGMPTDWPKIEVCCNNPAALICVQITQVHTLPSQFLRAGDTFPVIFVNDGCIQIPRIRMSGDVV